MCVPNMDIYCCVLLYNLYNCIMYLYTMYISFIIFEDRLHIILRPIDASRWAPAGFLPRVTIAITTSTT